ncbi:zwei Ig domain protein zig-8-like [Macrobrachium rosenbergii]|uniref:zwei Ig domain protein zig-8-like n=1 Tax=Macrobrachium rosenbergii TaxID=79674 RepID=UPI0034D6F0EF
MISSKILPAVVLLLITALLVVDGKVGGKPNQNKVGPADAGETWEEDDDASPPKGPHFAKDTPKSVLAAVGTPAHIPCKARNLGAKSVSWIRHKDLHVLTVGSFTFTNDERFSAHRDPSSGDWVLVLRHPQPSDSGYYECSISTKPVTAITVKLEVVTPTAELLGDGSVYLDKGSTLNLTCVVHFSPTPPEFILWYHREKLVNYGRRGGREIQVETEHRGEMTRSSLLVHNATLLDSGKYSCKPASAKKVSVVVHVLESETPEAMKTTTNGAAVAAHNKIIFSVMTAAAAAFCLLTISENDLNSQVVQLCLLLPFLSPLTSR